MRSLFFLTTLILVAAVGSKMVEAQVMTSGNYQIQSDSINFGGGFSSSTNYRQESTFGEVGSGLSESTSYKLRAGYQQMQEVYLALTGAANVTMTPAIDGLTGGIANGSTTVNAVTDSPGGYQLTIVASDSPAMQSSEDSMADYVPAGGVPDLHFVTDDSDAHFGFSPFGSHVVQKYQTNGSACNVSGSASSTACWDGLSTTEQTIAQSTSANHPDGTDTTVYFRVGVGPTALKVAGDYVATSTVTLLSL